MEEWSREKERERPRSPHRANETNRDPGESARQPFNNIWPLLQQNATAKIFVARAEPKLRDMNHIKKGLLCQNKSPFYANEFKACKKPDKKRMGKGGGAGTFKICILQIPINPCLVQLLLQEYPPLFGKCELPTLYFMTFHS